MFVEKFTIYSVNKIAANMFVSQKIESVHIYSCAQAKLPGFYHYPTGRWEFPIPPEQCFLKIFYPEEKGGERIMNLKK